MTCVTSTVTKQVTTQVTMTVANDIPIPAQEGSRKRRKRHNRPWKLGGRDGQVAAADGHRWPQAAPTLCPWPRLRQGRRKPLDSLKRSQGRWLSDVFGGDGGGKSVVVGIVAGVIGIIGWWTLQALFLFRCNILLYLGIDSAERVLYPV